VRLAPPRSLRGRLLLAVAGGLAPLLGLFAYTLLSHREEAAQRWLDRARYSVREASRVYQDVLTATRLTFNALAHAPLVERLDPQACALLFPSLYESHPGYTAIAVVRPDGLTACTYPSLGSDPIDLSDVPYYRQAVATGRFTVSDFHFGLRSGMPLVTAALPVYDDDGTLLATLVAGMNLNETAHTHGWPLPEGGSLTVFDRSGRVMARRPRADSLIGRPVAPELAQAALEGADGFVRAADVDGAPAAFMVTPIDVLDGEAGAYVAVGYEPEVISSATRRLARMDMLGFLLATLALLGGVWLILDALFLARLRPIVRAAARLGAGDLAARTGLPERTDEIGLLARTVDDMARRLQAARDREARRVEEALRERDDRFQQLAENIEVVFWMWDPARREVLYLSPAFEKVWGRPVEDAYADPSVLVRSIHEEDRDPVRLRRLGGRMAVGEDTYRIVRPDGEVRWVKNKVFAMRDGSGEIVRYVGVCEDVTERRQLEEALQQSAKLEAVGRLAGGVAHDFNNMLTAIRGTTHLLLEELGEDHPLREDILEIDRAAERAVGLTRQLLAFSRKQALRPRVIEVNETVESAARMLSRVLPASIELCTELAPGLPPIVADPGALEQAIMNLAVNARDAMTEGGRLTLRTRQVEIRAGRLDGPRAITSPGHYVVVDVVDTGTGIDPETLEHIFEPFFTTKELGKGTGLGLPSVYGSVKQAGGYIWVDSEVGRGSTFSLYLPRAEAEPAPAEPVPAGPAEVEGRGTILLVEDEPSVRSVARRALSRCGYTVLEAADGAEALRVYEEHGGRVDLLLTDVVMPRMGGPELYKELRTRDPDLPVLFMSGYPGREIAESGRFPDDLPFLQKPFTSATLQAEVRERLRTQPAGT